MRKAPSTGRLHAVAARLGTCRAFVQCCGTIIFLGAASAVPGQAADPEGTPRYCVSQERLGTVLVAASEVACSDDGCHVAWVEATGTEAKLVVDGREVSSHGNLRDGELVLSPDGQRVAYIASRGRGQVIVVDGQESATYDAISQGPQLFSPDGRRVAFVAQREGQWCVVLDGRQGQFYRGIGARSPVFSANGQSVGYRAQKGRKEVIVVNGREQAEYDRVGTPVFSADGRHVAYAVPRADKWFVVVDGREGPGYDDVSELSLTFSPDGKRLLYVAQRTGQWLVVVDGSEGPAYDGIYGESPFFSADGKRVVYVAQRAGRSVVVIDGNEGPYYQGIGGCSPFFSPDGQHVAYDADKGGKRAMVLDGQMGPDYDAFGAAVFSPDGRRLAYAATRGGKWFVVVDGVEGPEQERLREGCLKFTADSQRVVYAAANGPKCVLMIDGQAVAEYDDIRSIRSGGGQRLAFVAAKGDKSLAVVDGQEGPEYDVIAGNGPHFHEGGILEYLAVQLGDLYRVRHIPVGDSGQPLLTAKFTVRAGDAQGPLLAGATVELWYRATSSEQPVMLSRGTTDRHGRLGLDLALTPTQRAGGQFAARVKRGDRTRGWQLRDFPEKLEWRLYADEATWPSTGRNLAADEPDDGAIVTALAGTLSSVVPAEPDELPATAEDEARQRGVLRGSPDIDKFVAETWASEEPRDAGDFMMRGNARLFRGEMRQAIEDYNTAIQRAPKFTVAYYNRARAWMQLAEFDKALADLNRVIELDPGYPDAHGNRGLVLGQLRRFDEAIHDFGEEIEHSSDTAGGWYMARAMGWRGKGEFRKALADVRTAVKESPDEPRILNAAAWFMATCPSADGRDGPAAVQLATHACETTDWKEPALLDTLAAACAEAGQFAEAVKRQQQALELAPPAEKATYASRLGLYRGEQAYRDESMRPGPLPTAVSGSAVAPRTKSPNATAASPEEAAQSRAAELRRQSEEARKLAVETDAPIRRAPKSSPHSSLSRIHAEHKLRLLAHSEPFFRESAVREIDQWASLDMVPTLVKSLEDESRVVRAAILKTLGRLKATEAVEPVARRLVDDVDRHLAIETLKQISPTAIETVLAYLDGDSAPLRQAACALASNIDLQPQTARDILHKLAAQLDGDAAATRLTARTIQRLLRGQVEDEVQSSTEAPSVPEQVAQVIRHGMDSPHPAGRVWAIRLAIVAGPQVKGLIRSVAEALQDESPEVRRAAAAALLEMTEIPGSVKPPRLASDEPVPLPEVPPKLADAFEQWMTDPDPTTRFWSARMASELGAAAKPVLPALLKLCEDSQPEVRSTAVESVMGLCDSLCGDRLASLPQLQEVAQAINALGTGPEEQAAGYSPSLLEPLRRIWPVDAESPEAFGNRGLQSTTGPGSIEWFGYRGAGDWKVFAVEAKRPLLLRTRGDGRFADEIRFTVSEYEGGRWVVKQTITGPDDFSGYRWYFHTPSSDRIRLDAQGRFYVFVYQL